MLERIVVLSFIHNNSMVDKILFSVVVWLVFIHMVACQQKDLIKDDNYYYEPSKPSYLRIYQARTHNYTADLLYEIQIINKANP